MALIRSPIHWEHTATKHCDDCGKCTSARSQSDRCIQSKTTWLMFIHPKFVYKPKNFPKFQSIFFFKNTPKYDKLSKISNISIKTMLKLRTSSETSETSEISDIFRMDFGNNTPSVLNAAIWLAPSPCTFPVLDVKWGLLAWHILGCHTTRELPHLFNGSTPATSLAWPSGLTALARVTWPNSGTVSSQGTRGQYGYDTDTAR